MLKIVAAAAAMLLPTVAMAGDWGPFYGEVYGGGSVANDSNWDGSDYALDPGPMFGASLGVNSPVPGLSFELDAMGTSANFSAAEVIRSFSVMVGAEYSVPLNDTFDVYGAVGIGVLNYAYTDTDTEPDYSADGWGAGYQLAGGVRARVMENVSLFSEVKFQNSFAPITVGGPEVTNPKLGLVAGLRFGF